jgi:hypothetical protein
MPQPKRLSAAKDPIPVTLAHAMRVTNRDTEAAVDYAWRVFMDGVNGPNVDTIGSLVRTAVRVLINADHRDDRKIRMHNARHPEAPISISTRRPIVGRVSNVAAQESIDGVWETFFNGKRLGDMTRNDLFRASDKLAKSGATMIANAEWLRAVGKRVQGGKTLSQTMSSIEVVKAIRRTGGDLAAL